VQNANQLSQFFYCQISDKFIFQQHSALVHRTIEANNFLARNFTRC